MIKKHLSFFLSPALIAAVLFAIVIIVIPPFSKYTHNTIRSLPVDFGEGTMIYYDLDGNGTDEQVVSTVNVRNHHAIKVRTWDGRTIEQYNLKGQLNGRSGQVAIGDYNNDRLNELFALHHIEDTLFLSYFSFITGEKPFIKEEIITTISRTEGMVDFDCSMKLVDMNLDGHLDVLINVKAGFSLQPRQLYCYDIINDSLWSSPATGNIAASSKVTQLDDDLYPELLLNCSSTGNIPYDMDIPYKDSSAWLYAFDHNLEFLFEPVEFPGYGSQINSYTFLRDGRKMILVFYDDKSYHDKGSELFLYDIQGKLIDKKPVNLNGYIDISFRQTNGQGPKYFLVDRRFVYELNEDLEFIKKKDLGNDIFSKVQILSDTLPYEINLAVVSMKKNTVMIFNKNLEDIFMISFPFKSKQVTVQTVKGAGIPANSISLITGGINYILQIKPNVYYKFRFILFIILYVLILLFILLIAKLQRMRLKKKYELDTQMTELQIKTIKSQMDPHFTFNALNSISSVIFKEEKETAYNYFSKFSKLVRLTLEDSNKISRSLEDELEFVENYLELEKFRFKNRLTYEIDVAVDVNKSILIPRMIIQTFVENAVTHGILPKKSKGLLKIDIKRTINHLEIIVEDDGIGIKESKNRENSKKSRGLKIIDEMISLYAKLEGKHINYQITDLTTPEAGTRVTIFIPL